MKKFFRAVCVLILVSASAVRAPGEDSPGVVLNDIHSALNETRVREVYQPASAAEIADVIKKAKAQNAAVSISGGRHAMGGQQFGADTLHIDMSRMNRILAFDRKQGRLTVEAGAQWPEIVKYLLKEQEGQKKQWGVIQKQTGASTLSIGGTLSANAHGRGLLFKPIIDQVESFVLVDADGEIKRCSRSENAELFRLVIGGYGLFGVIAEATLRLGPRQKVERVVELSNLTDLMKKFDERIAQGFTHGDFQYLTDPTSQGFLWEGVFPCYRPVPDETPLTKDPKVQNEADWRGLYYLSHADPKKAFLKYSQYYLSTSGQVYWSDTADLANYIEGYHEEVDRRTGTKNPGSEMITEIYVPRGKLADFMQEVRADFLQHNVPIIYGTIRLVEKDGESFLAWARDNWACVIFNLHVEHTPEGIAKATEDFQRLIDRAIEFQGSYYLTYHRWARKDQVLACYPQFVQFLKLKLKYDPQERFQSEWYRHYREMFGEELAK